MNDFIYLNDKIFQIVDRQTEDIWIGNNFERTLSGRGTIDRTIQKTEFSFGFWCDNDRELSRLHSIYDLNDEISLIDCDGSSYTVVITNNFKPVYNKNGSWSVSLDMKEV
jgi:hypothetical protein